MPTKELSCFRSTQMRISYTESSIIQRNKTAFRKKYFLYCISSKFIYYQNYFLSVMVTQCIQVSQRTCFTLQLRSKGLFVNQILENMLKISNVCKIPVWISSVGREKEDEMETVGSILVIELGQNSCSGGKQMHKSLFICLPCWSFFL